MSGQNLGVQYKIRVFRFIAPGAQRGLFVQRSDQFRNGGRDFRKIGAQLEDKTGHLFDHFAQAFESRTPRAGELKDGARRQCQQTCRSGDLF